MVFAHLGTAWAPCGQLVLTEEADRLLASSFAYGLNYLKRSDALEVDPVNLSLADREAVRAKRLLPANRPPFIGGIRDAAPDALGRRAPQGFDPRRGRCAVPGQIRKPPRRFDIPAIECASGAATSPRPACRRPSRTRSPRRFGTSTMCPLQPCGSCFREASPPKPATTPPPLHSTSNAFRSLTIKNRW